MTFAVRWARKERTFTNFVAAKRFCDRERARGHAAYVLRSDGVELTVRGRPWTAPRGHYVVALAAKLRGTT